MYQEHPVFQDPPSGNSIWRYFTFTKMLSLMETKSLFFTRADSFEDPFEGSWPKSELILREERRISQLRKNYPGISQEEIKKILDEDSQFFKSTREFTLLSCWHYNTSESAAMWKLFPKSDEGLSVQTTAERLKAAFSANPEPVYIGMVNYIDYETERFLSPFDSPFVAYIHKRKQFEHEKEYRAILSLQPNHEWEEEGAVFGLYVPVDINMLIDKIYVSPDAPKWYLKLIRKVLKDYGLNKEVLPSSMSLKPVF